MHFSHKGRWFKYACFVLFVCLRAAGNSSAQELPGSGAPNIQILKIHWEKQVRLPRNFDPAEISTGSTFNDPASRTSAAAPTTTLDATRAATSAQSAAAGSSTAFPAIPARLPVVFVYSLKIKNNSEKVIAAIAWDYIFFDKSSNKELGRHQFLSYQKVSAGQSVTFKSQLRSPPTRVVQASDSETKQPQFAERAIVQCVLYADDSNWRNKDAQGDACSLLRKSKNLLRQNRRG